MKFSILVPVYNVEKYLDECVQSVINQTFTDWQLILVNDGSTDTSGKICDEYSIKDNRIKVIHTDNHGLSTARKEGIKNAEGEYCVFLDSDDFLATNCLMKLSETIENFDADMVIFNFYVYKEGKAECYVGGVGFEEMLMSKEELQKHLISSQKYNSIVRKTVKTTYMKESPFLKEDLSFTIGEDKIFTLYPATVCERIAIIPDPLFYYRFNDTSMTRTYSKKYLVDRMGIGVVKYLHTYMKRWNMTSNEDFEAFSTMFWKDLVKVCDMLSGGLCDKNTVDTMVNFKFKKQIPDFILGYMKCKKLSFKEKVKLFILTSRCRIFLRMTAKERK